MEWFPVASKDYPGHRKHVVHGLLETFYFQLFSNISSSGRPKLNFILGFGEIHYIHVRDQSSSYALLHGTQLALVSELLYTTKL